MRQEEFRKFLRTKGKQVYVVDQMIKLAAGFEANSGKSLDNITAKDLARLLPELERKEPGLGKETARAVGLYLAMAGKSEAAAAAWAFREEAIARQRAPLLLKQFLDVAPDAVERLRAVGIVNAEDARPRQDEARAGSSVTPNRNFLRRHPGVGQAVRSQPDFRREGRSCPLVLCCGPGSSGQVSPVGSARTARHAEEVRCQDRVSRHRSATEGSALHCDRGKDAARGRGIRRLNVGFRSG